MDDLLERLPDPAGSRIPGFAGATGWLNSAPLTPADLHGKVVAVDFWTYTCVNWLRTLPYRRAWAEAYGPLNEPNGGVTYRFHARDLNLILAAADDAPARFRVTLDGQPPRGAHGVDVDDDGNGIVREPRLYQLIRQPPPINDRVFEMELLDAGPAAFCFTFG